MTPYLNRLDEVVRPGLITITWIALNIPSFVESIHRAVGEVDLLIDRVTGVQQNRIELALQEMLKVELCALPPRDEVMTIEEFQSGTKVRTYVLIHCAAVTLSLASMNQAYIYTFYNQLENWNVLREQDCMLLLGISSLCKLLLAIG